MFSRHSDLPFERDQSTRFLPWIVALMVFLGALMFAAALVVSDAVDTWDSSLTGRMTIQIPENETPGDTIPKLTEALQTVKDITSVRIVPDAEARALLIPWLGEGVVESGLPIPSLIDVEIDAGSRIDPVLLQARLAEIAPNVAVDDHRAWLSALIDLARTAEILAFAILALIASAAVVAVIFTTQSGLAVHAAIIELLHQMGARDSYIASQFQLQALMLSLRGGVAGGAAAVIVLLFFGWIGRGIDAAFLPSLSLSLLDWIFLLLVPAGAVTIAMLTARVTVLRTLARMP
ncbi:MAG: cell division protein [Alphaproteobacteria bacterium]|nr:cell division protein [Alphaproteobacteria bacterium]